MNQRHPYNADLSYHFANLTLTAELQPLWEADEQKHPETENLLAIPRSYYDKLFIAGEGDGEAIYQDIQGYVQEHYEQIGVMRVGVDIVPDHREAETNATLQESDSSIRILSTMFSYSRRFTETLTDRVRYGFSKLLMGYVLRSKVNGHGVVVLRGTVSTEEWLNNMNYRLVPFHPQKTEYGRVHNGFRDIFKGIRGQYRQLVTEIDPDKDLYFIGHSLGAAVAQLAALDIALTRPERSDGIQVYTYAAPRVGNPIFADTYDEVVGTSYRIVNVCDVVPYVPFEELGEYIRMKPYPYADTKGELAYIHQTGNPIANHVSSYHIATLNQIPAELDVSQPVR